MSKSENLTFDVLIEIPKGSRNKYEYDFKLNKIRFDRMLFSSMMYPGDYGFVPETLALDSDPLDVLVLGTEPTFPMCVMEVRPIGVFHMTVEKGTDEKIWCFIFNPKKGGGGTLCPPSTFTQFFDKNAIVTDAHSICKFLNIRCGRFDTILRLLRFLG